MKAHAQLGASKADRWMNCPGSIRLEGTVPEGSGDTFYAAEGTAAHTLGELALTRNADPILWLGTKLGDIEVTEEMVDAVRLYVDTIRGRMEDNVGGAQFIEKKFSLLPLNPPAPMYGTSDAATYFAPTRTLFVDDLKYGRGVLVDADDNPQLKYYALGAVLEVEKDIGAGKIDTITMSIIQPRAHHPLGPVRSFTMTYMDLLDFAGDLLSAAKVTLQANAPFKAGDWCRFCRAAPICQTKHEQVLSVAKIEFQPITDLPVVNLPDPNAMSQEQMLKVLAVAGEIESWFKALREYRDAELKAGRPFPGWKLVEGRLGNRKWINEEEAQAFLLAQGWKSEDILVSELKGPAPIEKLLGKKNFPKELVERAPGQYTSVPEDDPRPEVQLMQAIAPASVDLIL